MSSSNSVAGQQITSNPGVVWQDCFPLPVAVTVYTNFAGTITAATTSAGCTLSSGAQEAAGTPGDGGTKSAIFTITPAVTGCTVTFTDKKGNTATTTVNVASGQGSCWI